MANRLVLITGASAGLGAAFAHRYAARGWDVALTARRADRLDALAREIEDRHGVTALTIPQDLAKPDAVDAILAEISAAGRHVDGLVNNAGYSLEGTFFTTDWDDQAIFIRVLFTVPCEIAHKVLPGMAERNYGRIINVASIAGYTPGSFGLYGSVKSALIKFSESVHAEADAAGHNIHCTALCPGLTRTEFHDVANMHKIAEDTPDWMWMEAEPVAEAGIAAVTRGQPVCVPGAVNKGITTLTKLLPEPLARLAMKQQAKTFGGE